MNMNLKREITLPGMLLLLVSGIMTGCGEKTESEGNASAAGSCRTVFIAEPLAETKAASATDETKIADVNLWAFHESSGNATHLYSSSGAALPAVELLPGTYRIYTIANSGKDLGEMDEQLLQTLAASFSGEPGDGAVLPMAARSEIAVSKSASVTLPVERLVAKLSLSLSVAPALQGSLILESVQLLSVPNRCLYFADNRTSDPASSIDYTASNVSGASFSRTYYLPENLAGTNSSVSSERQKDKAHAPSGATWLRIEARHNDRPVTYSVYLGANNTTDFNVSRNTVQYLNITLSGSEPGDLRVARFSLSLGTPAASYLPLDKVSVPLTFTAENQAGNSFTLRCALTQGQGRVLLDGTDITSTSVSLPSTGSTRTLTFEPSAYGQQAALTLTVSDAEGRQVSRSLSTYIKPKGELQFSMPSLGQPTAGSRSSFPLTVSEENYAGTFRLQFSTATASSVGSFYFQGKQIASGAPADFTVAAGTHNVEFAAANSFGGELSLTATVTDDWGESRSVTRTASVKPEVIELHPALDVEIVRESALDSAYTMMPYVTLEVTADKTVPTAVTVTVDVICTGHNTLNGSQQSYTVPQSVTIPAGSTVSNAVRLRWPMGTPYYHTSDDSYVSPGYEYRQVQYNMKNISPSSYGGVVFQ